MEALIQGWPQDNDKICGAHPNERRVAAKATMYGNLGCAVRRGRDGKEKYEE